MVYQTTALLLLSVLAGVIAQYPGFDGYGMYPGFDYAPAPYPAYPMYGPVSQSANANANENTNTNININNNMGRNRASLLATHPLFAQFGHM